MCIANNSIYLYSHMFKSLKAEKTVCQSSKDKDHLWAPSVAQNDIAPKSSQMLCDYASGFYFQIKFACENHSSSGFELLEPANQPDWATGSPQCAKNSPMQVR